MKTQLYYWSLVLCLFIITQSYGIVYQLNQQESHSELTIYNYVNAGPAEDSSFIDINELFFDRSVMCRANSTRSSAYAQQAIRFVCTFSPDKGDPAFDEPVVIPENVDMSLVIAMDGSGQAYIDMYEENNNWRYDSLQMSCDLHSQAELVWELQPGQNVNEWEGMPVVVKVWADYFLAGNSSNGETTGPCGITNLNFNDGAVGPLYSYHNYDGDYFNQWPVLRGEDYGKEILIPLGEALKIEYSYDFHTAGPAHVGGYYWQHPYVPNDLYICARAKKYDMLSCFDKQYLAGRDLLDEVEQRTVADGDIEAARVSSVYPDGSTQLILAIDGFDVLFGDQNIPSDTENPTLIHLSILSPDGKDNGRLIYDDNDSDGYTDTARIKEGVFTQTWCAPAEFDSVEGAANKAESRQIPVQIEIDRDGDGSFDYVFIEHLKLLHNVYTIGTDTSGWDYPLHTSYHDSRTQVIYRASEIGRSGLVKSLAIDVTSVPGQKMDNWTIRMKHTDMNSYDTPSFESTGWTVVYQSDEPAGNTGWREFNFSKPFMYNGKDNLLIDFSHNNDYYTSSGTCMSSIPGGMRSACACSNSEYGDPLDWSGTTSPSVYGSNNVPNIKLMIYGIYYIADFDGNGKVDFTDFATFANRWLEADCEASNNWCEGSDLDRNGNVDLTDLAAISERWLKLPDESF